MTARTLLILFCLPLGLLSQTYTNVAFEQGIFVLVQNAYVGCGASFYDINGDGWDDVTLCSPGNNIHIYLNNNGTLSAAPVYLPNSSEAKMPLWGDFDNDGDADLLITKANAQTQLLRNDGDWAFTDITVASGIPIQPFMRSYGAAWGDYDRDGFLDLYICNYNFNGDISNYLLHNNGDGTFDPVHNELGVSNEVRPSFQPAFTDYNHDLWPDIYVINDKIDPNVLYENNGNGTFTDVSGATFTNLAIDAMSNSWCDFDHDGDLDVYVTNATAGNKFLINNGDGTFTESAEEYGLEVFSICWGATWMDYDLDGWEDLHVTSTLNGFAGNQNYFYPNVDGAFELDLLESGFINDYYSSYAAARGDLNNDGYPDLLENNEFPDYATLWQSSGGDGHWVKLTLQGVVSNREGVGAWITAYAGDLVHHHFTQSGESYMSQHSQHQIFGLGEASQLDSVQVEWPSGHVDWFYDLEEATRHTLVEGQSTPAYVQSDAYLLCTGDSAALEVLHLEAPVWNTGEAAATITVDSPGWYSASGTDVLGQQVVSDSVFIAFSAPADIAVVTTPATCHGEANGTATFYSPTGDLFVWDANASDAAGFTGLQAGTYTYVFNNDYGCPQSIEVIIEQPEVLEAQILWDGTTLEATALGGTPPYTFIWDTGATGNTFTPVASGVYTCLVSDALGCFSQIEAQAQLPLSIMGIPSTSGFSAHPNPASDRLFVRLPAAGTLVLRSLAGQLIYHTPVLPLAWVDLPPLAAGQYLLELQTPEQTWHQRWVIR